MYEPSSRNILSAALARLLDFLLPNPCLGCSSAPAHRANLCVRCWGRLRPLVADVCRTCATPLRSRPRSATGLCGDCRAHPPPWCELLTLWAYDEPASSLVQALKFRRMHSIGDHLARLLVETHAEALARYDLVVPIPLHWRRFLERGYNQAEAIASPLAAHIERPLRNALRRHRHGPSQAGSSQEARKRNVRGAFRVRARHRSELAGARVLLVDDVTTTGATLGAATRALETAGVATVGVATAVKTPR